MKKVLFASVAAIAFGAAAAQAAEPVKLSIGGYATQWAGYASNSDTAVYGTSTGPMGNYGSATSGAAANQRSKFDVQDDVQINFTGSTKLDNGIGVSVEVDTMGTQGENTHTQNAGNKDVKKSFVAVSSAYGTVEAGEQDNVGALIHVSSPDVGGIGGQDGNWMNWVIAPSNFAETNQRTYAGDDRSANKIIYVSPTWQGLTAGFSYTPSINTASTGHTSIVSSNNVVSTGNTNGTGVLGSNYLLNGDLYVYGVAYANTFGDVSVKADAGSGNAAAANLHVYQGGLNVSYKGFTLGGSALKRDADTDISSKTNGIGGLGLTGYQVGQAAELGTLYDAGLSYATGPYAVSLTWFHGEALNASVSSSYNEKKYDTDHALTLAGAYDLGPGVKLTESIFTVDYKSADNSQADKNNGWAAITGIGVTF